VTLPPFLQPASQPALCGVGLDYWTGHWILGYSTALLRTVLTHSTICTLTKELNIFILAKKKILHLTSPHLTSPRLTSPLTTGLGLVLCDHHQPSVFTSSPSQSPCTPRRRSISFYNLGASRSGPLDDYFRARLAISLSLSLTHSLTHSSHITLFSCTTHSTHSTRLTQ